MKNNECFTCTIFNLKHYLVFIVISLPLNIENEYSFNIQHRIMHYRSTSATTYTDNNFKEITTVIVN